MIKRCLGLVVVACLTGCAFTTEQIDVQYNQQPGVSAVDGASKVMVGVQIVDQRPDKTKVSSKKNGYGMETAPIVTTEEVTVTIRRAVEEELRARGFQITAEAASVQITADLTRFYNEYKMGFWSVDAIADLNLLVTVKGKDGAVLYTRQIVARGEELANQVMGGENARLALNKALENGMQLLFGDQAFIASLVASSARKG